MKVAYATRNTEIPAYFGGREFGVFRRPKVRRIFTAELLAYTNICVVLTN